MPKTSSVEDDFRASLLQFQSSGSNNQSTTGLSAWIPTSTDEWKDRLSRPFQRSSSNNNNSSTDEWFKMTAFQRTMGFVMCTIVAFICFVLAMVTLPTCIINPAKFTLTYTMASLFSIAAFAVLRGPKSFAKHLISPERRLFTTAYFGSMFLTLFAVIYVKQYLFIIFCAILQFIAIIWYYASYLPGGTTGMTWITRAFVRTASGSAINI